MSRTSGHTIVSCTLGRRANGERNEGKPIRPSGQDSGNHLLCNKAKGHLPDQGKKVTSDNAICSVSTTLFRDDFYGLVRIQVFMGHKTHKCCTFQVGSHARLLQQIQQKNLVEANKY